MDGLKRALSDGVSPMALRVGGLRYGVRPRTAEEDRARDVVNAAWAEWAKANTDG